MSELPPSSVVITDYIEDPSVERVVLGSALAEGPHANALVALVWRQKVDDAFLAGMPRLRAIVRYGAGFEDIDLVATARRSILVCNNPAYGVDEVADTAIAMTLALARGLLRYDVVAAGLPARWQQLTLPSVRRFSDMTFGVVGAGRIGSAALLKARALSFRTCFYDPYQPRGLEKVLRADRADELEELLGRSDVVSLHTPLTQETVGLVDEAFLAQMKPGSYLINTSRGKVVANLDPIFEALKDEQLAGVGLDVLPEEPPSERSALIAGWRNRDPSIAGRCIINPHTAYYSVESQKEMRETVALNAARILRGQTPWNVVSGPFLDPLT